MKDYFKSIKNLEKEIIRRCKNGEFNGKNSELIYEAVEMFQYDSIDEMDKAGVERWIEIDGKGRKTFCFENERGLRMRIVEDQL